MVEAVCVLPWALTTQALSSKVGVLDRVHLHHLHHHHHHQHHHLHHHPPHAAGAQLLVLSVVTPVTWFETLG